MRGPFAASRPGCGGALHASAKSGPKACPAPPTWFGYVFFPYPRPGELRLGFACDEHRDLLDVARPFDEKKDRAELERRRERDRLVIEEKQPVRKDPPIATGADALARLAAARKYGNAHAEDEGWWVNPDGESRAW